jgi:hypothetical protein
MAEPVSVKIEGLNELIAKMQRVKDGAYVTKALKVGGERVRDKTGKYPPAGDANNPSNKRWYERNYGPKWRTVDGAVKGKKTSEMLGKKWYVNAYKYSVAVGNKVSYAPYVHGDNSQAKNMGDKGWKKLGATAKEQAKEIVKDIQAAFVQMWKNAQ